MSYKHLVFYFCLVIFLCSCDSDNREFSSDAPSSDSKANSEVVPSNNVQKKSNSQNKQSRFFVFTNDFHSSRGLDRPYIRLVGNGNKSYILPPVEYEELTLKYIMIKGFKVKSGCVKVPEHAFPLSVNVCSTPKCDESRFLANFIVPNHYGISGVGDLLIPQIHPVSPCSEEFVNLMSKDKD